MGLPPFGAKGGEDGVGFGENWLLRCLDGQRGRRPMAHDRIVAEKLWLHDPRHFLSRRMRCGHAAILSD
jgi:hypothetical protein